MKEYIKGFLDGVSEGFVNFWKTGIYYKELDAVYNVYTYGTPKKFMNCYRVVLLSRVGILLEVNGGLGVWMIWI